MLPQRDFQSSLPTLTAAATSGGTWRGRYWFSARSTQCHVTKCSRMGGTELPREWWPWVGASNISSHRQEVASGTCSRPDPGDVGAEVGESQQGPQPGPAPTEMSRNSSVTRDMPAGAFLGVASDGTRSTPTLWWAHHEPGAPVRRAIPTPSAPHHTPKVPQDPVPNLLSIPGKHRG